MTSASSLRCSSLAVARGQGMPWLDLLLVAILIAFAANGLKQGLIRQVANLIGFFLGLTLAIALYVPLVSRLASSPESESTLGPLIFVAILLSIWGISSLLGIIARKKSRARDNNWRDDLGGALLSLASGVFALAVFLAGFASLDRSFAQQVESSRLGTRLLDITWAIFRLLPSGLQLPAWLQ